MKLLNKSKFILLTLIFTVILLSGKLYATTGIITDVSVNVREKPSTDSKKIMYVTQDDEVEILEKSGEWYKIKFKNTTGYVYEKYIKVDENNNITNTDERTEESAAEEDKEEQEVTKDVEEKLKINDKTTIRIVPSISSNVIYTSKKAESIEIVEQINEWTYICVNNIYGWVRTDKIIEDNVVETKTDSTNEVTEQKENEATKKENTKTAYIKYTTVNLREKPSATSKSLAKLKLNDEVTVIEKADSVWSKVEVDGTTGYISTELLSDKKQGEESKDNNTTSRSGSEASRDEEKKSEEENGIVEKTETKATEKEENTTNTDATKITGEDIVAYAKKYLGYNYVYGGASPSKGFDCSGLTYYVYKHFGYTISRSSTAQANNGTKVAKKDLQPGDLVIYKNNSLTRIGHVGIYIGNNKMIHASEPGVGVVITDIDSKAHKYPQRFVMGRRIIK